MNVLIGAVQHDTDRPDRLQLGNRLPRRRLGDRAGWLPSQQGCVTFAIEIPTWRETNKRSLPSQMLDVTA